jgi:predicted RNase H-like HicB family nuclease
LGTLYAPEYPAYNSQSEVQMKYRIALHKSEEGYSVSVPGLPGYWSQGTTEQEALENIRDAIREYLSVVEDQLRGDEIREIEVAV